MQNVDAGSSSIFCAISFHDGISVVKLDKSEREQWVHYAWPSLSPTLDIAYKQGVFKPPGKIEFSLHLDERCSIRLWSGECFHAPLGNYESFETFT